MVIYYITRTFLNGLRSIEALVMAIVFVIAVGIGPFAGVMALGLHTIVSLAKLYSEQVESILSGPLEAIEATGANRLQTIIYAVIPQIVPPYISYTMYRWDINVRMSTIIGFVGGGGIGFLLQQNINLLNYRAASAQMLAIAIVVASMDYISSVLRGKRLCNFLLTSKKDWLLEPVLFGYILSLCIRILYFLTARQPTSIFSFSSHRRK